ncbi:MAG: LysR family transcriptional regulator [Lysobacterales bacterium]
MAAFKLTQLRHFKAVAEIQSIGFASKVLDISQPALSRSIQRLEQDLGGPLFERSSKGVALTARGTAVLPYVSSMLAEADRAIEHLAAFSGDRRSQIKLGVSPNFIRHVVPEVMTDFVEKYPSSNIVTVTGSGEQILSMLSAAEIDLGITMSWGTSLQTALGKNLDLSHERVAQLKAKVFAPAEHPLTKCHTLTLEELASHRWAVPHGLSISYVFQDIFASQKLPPPAQIINSSSVSQMIELSQRLNLLLILPQHVVADEVRCKKLFPLDCPDLELLYHVELITRRRGTKTSGLNFFRQRARARFADAKLT